MARRKNNQKWIIWGVVLVVAIMAVVLGVVLLNNANSGDAREEESSEQEEQKDYSEEARAKIEKLEEEEKRENVNYNSAITGTITHQAVENGRFVLRIAIDQPVDTEGACRLSIVSNGVEKHNSVVLMEPNSSNYSCSFNIPFNEYSKGSYSFDVKLETDSQSGNLKGEFVYE